MYCHRCSIKHGIDAGVYAGVAFEDLPCRDCLLEESSIGTMAFNEEREDELLQEGLGVPEAPPAEMLPVSVLGDTVKLFLTLSDEDFGLVRDRYAGKSYAQIATERQVTTQAVEVRQRRILEKVPNLGYLFPSKTRKRQARQRRNTGRGDRGGVQRNKRRPSQGF